MTDALTSLDKSGVQVAIGPFLVHVKSEFNGVREYLERLYADFPMTAAEGGHFDITIAGSRGIRRWIRPQANLIINGSRPFLPLPANLSGALGDFSLTATTGWSDSPLHKLTA